MIVFRGNYTCRECGVISDDVIVDYRSFYRTCDDQISLNGSTFKSKTQHELRLSKINDSTIDYSARIIAGKVRTINSVIQLLICHGINKNLMLLAKRSTISFLKRSGPGFNSITTFSAFLRAEMLNCGLPLDLNAYCSILAIGGHKMSLAQIRRCSTVQGIHPVKGIPVKFYFARGVEKIMAALKDESVREHMRRKMPRVDLDDWIRRLRSETFSIMSEVVKHKASHGSVLFGGAIYAAVKKLSSAMDVKAPVSQRWLAKTLGVDECSVRDSYRSIKAFVNVM